MATELERTALSPAFNESIARRLIAFGALLFLLGLVSGLLMGLATNPRMALSAHMQGLTNGTFLIAIGAVWERIRLPEPLQRLTFWALLVGAGLNWLTVQLAALWGTGRLTPIAGAGFQGKAWQEMIVSTGLLVVTVAMLLAGVLIVAGFVRRRAG